MRYLLYCIMGFNCENDALLKRNGHLHWFNPNLVSCAETNEKNCLVKLYFYGCCMFWCDLGSWQSAVEEIHKNYNVPNEVKIQEVVVTE